LLTSPRIVVGSIVFVVILIILACCIRRRYRANYVVLYV
jgi:hypothetical protein